MTTPSGSESRFGPSVRHASARDRLNCRFVLLCCTLLSKNYSVRVGCVIFGIPFMGTEPTISPDKTRHSPVHLPIFVEPEHVPAEYVGCLKRITGFWIVWNQSPDKPNEMGRKVRNCFPQFFMKRLDAICYLPIPRNHEVHLLCIGVTFVDLNQNLIRISNEAYIVWLVQPSSRPDARFP